MTSRFLEAIKRRPYTATVFVVLVYLMGLIHAFRPVLRFQSRIPNVLFFCLILLLPWIALTIVIAYGSRLRRVAGIFLLVPILLTTVPMAPATLFYLTLIISQEGDPVFDRLHSLPLSGNDIVVYRTNIGGPTTSFGIVVQQERRLLPGLLLVRRLAGFSPAAEATAERFGPNLVRIEVPPYGPRHPHQTETIRVKTYVYF